MSTYKVKGKVVYLMENPCYSMDNAEQAKNLKSFLNNCVDTIEHQTKNIEELNERIKRLESAGDGLWAFLQNRHGFSPEGITLLSINWMKAKMMKEPNGSR